MHVLTSCPPFPHFPIIAAHPLPRQFRATPARVRITFKYHHCGDYSQVSRVHIYRYIAPVKPITPKTPNITVPHSGTPGKSRLRAPSPLAPASSIAVISSSERTRSPAAMYPSSLDFFELCVTITPAPSRLFVHASNTWSGVTSGPRV
jgi:hypothetical protein